MKNIMIPIYEKGDVIFSGHWPLFNFWNPIICSSQVNIIFVPVSLILSKEPLEHAYIFFLLNALSCFLVLRKSSSVSQLEPPLLACHHTKKNLLNGHALFWKLTDR